MADERPRIFPASKRLFDLFVTLALAPGWIVVLLLCAAAQLAFEGRPVLYASSRRVHGRKVITILKFRTLRRDADKLFNRETVPVDRQRFLNISADSPLYTPTGRLIERTMLTELPQVLHVLRGHMSLVGNRPLPLNVVEALREQHPDVDLRFRAPAGLTGPVQLVGRDDLSDTQRLALEYAYVARVAHASAVLLDLKILALTVAAGLSSRWRLTYQQALELVALPSDATESANPGASLPGKPHS